MFKNNRESEKIMKDSKEFTEQIDTLIGQESVVTGDLRFKSGLYVQGTVDGTIEAVDSKDGEFRLLQTGRIKGKVTAPYLIINGIVEGDLVATGKIELQSNAQVTGNIYYESIEMHMGARVNGQLIHESKQSHVSLASDNSRDKEAKKTG